MSKLNKKQRLLDRIARKGNLLMSNESLSLNELSNNELLHILSELEWGIIKGQIIVKKQELSWSLQKK